jgi:hypothetical protein
MPLSAMRHVKLRKAGLLTGIFASSSARVLLRVFPPWRFAAGGGALDLGSMSHETRARLRQVDRSGFYMPNWERWSAKLSA